MATRVAGRFEPSARLTPANLLTAVRLLATPVMLVLILDLGASWVSAGVWVAVASTDFLDGWLARRQGATTSGAFLDPLADKVLVLGALASLAVTGAISWLPVGLIAAREVAMSVYRSRVARRGISVPARPLAKMKTLAQDCAIGLLLIPVTGLHHPWVGEAILWVSVFLAWASFVQYMLDSRRPVVKVRTAPDELPAT
jgi:CDP-diacylglycerol--glycerol-3-phosphate 3-phosphatidyltransferase